VAVAAGFVSGLAAVSRRTIFRGSQVVRDAVEFFDGTPLTGKALLARLLLARIALQVGDLAAAEAETNAAVAKLSNAQAPCWSIRRTCCWGKLRKPR